MDTRSTDKRFLARDSDPLDLEIVRSEGSVIYDREGKKYIDFLGGWCVSNWGWGEKQMEKAVSQPHPTYVHPSLLYKPWALLSQMLAEITPGKLVRSFRATGGSEAVEAALQIAMLYTKRSKFLSIEGSYHGNTIGALSIGASTNRKKFPNLLPGCLKIETPLDKKNLAKAEKLLKQKDIAALIMEPVICNLGVLVPDAEFMHELAGYCKKYGTLLVMDEVACGFGRTGKLFATEHYMIEPDIMCLAKAITGGYAGLGATVTTEKVARSVKDDLHFYSTYGWHPLAVNAAIGNIVQWIQHKENRLAHIAKMSDLFASRLQQIKFRGGSKINIKGLAIGIELRNARYAGKIAEKCLTQGLLIQSDEEKLMLFPPLGIEEKTAGRGLEILENCV